MHKHPAKLGKVIKHFKWKSNEINTARQIAIASEKDPYQTNLNHECWRDPFRASNSRSLAFINNLTIPDMKQTLGWEPLIQSFNTNMKNLITRSNSVKLI